MSTNAQTGLEDEIASPGYYGSFPWVDRCRGIYGIVFVHNPGEGGRSLAVATRILDLIRKEVGGCAVTALSPNPVWRATPDMVFPGLSLPGSPAGYLIDGRVIPASRP
jgi:hypothetical protein